jgi:hypothetical protein
MTSAGGRSAAVVPNVPRPWSASPLQEGDQPVAAAPVHQAAPADVPVVPARPDQLGERELVQDTGIPIGRRLRVGHVVDELRGQHQPAEAQAGGEGLARGPGVGDAVRGERLERTDGLPVVAELSVVVVLDDEPAAIPAARAPSAGRSPGRPPAQRTTSVRRPGASATPSGNWCAGVSSAASASPNRATTAPSASTGTSRSRSPRAVLSWRWLRWPYASTATATIIMGSPTVVSTTHYTLQGPTPSPLCRDGRRTGTRPEP